MLFPPTPSPAVINMVNRVSGALPVTSGCRAFQGVCLLWSDPRQCLDPGRVQSLLFWRVETAFTCTRDYTLTCSRLSTILIRLVIDDVAEILAPWIFRMPCDTYLSQKLPNQNPLPLSNLNLDRIQIFNG
jgi:hypothetical protein